MLSKEEINFNKARDNLYKYLAAISIVNNKYYDLDIEVNNSWKMNLFILEMRRKVLHRGTVIDRISHDEDDDDSPVFGEETGESADGKIIFLPETYDKYFHNPEEVADEKSIPIQVKRLVLEKDKKTGHRYFKEDLISKVEDLYQKYLDASKELDEYYETLIENSPSGAVIKTIRNGPGILEDYRQDSWGIKRICLDGFQNHLPSDSNGTKCYLEFLVEGKWVSREEALTQVDKIKEVRFMDNGVGFTYNNLLLLHSTKSSEDNSAGQFGEGMKLLSIAAVKLNLDLEFQSRNWSARATSEMQRMVNTRKGDKTEYLRRLVFDVTVYDGEPIVGSKTIFHNPSREFIDYALHLPEKILVLGNRKAIYSSDQAEIIDCDKGGEVFVKSIYIKDMPSFFTYNFLNANVNPDRNDFNNYNYKSAIALLIASIKDFDFIKKFLKKIIEYCVNPENKGWQWEWEYNIPVELSIGKELRYCLSFDDRLNWKNAFYEACIELGLCDRGDEKEKPKVALKTDFKPPSSFEKAFEEYTFINFSKEYTDFFTWCEILRDEDIVPNILENTIETSLTKDYGAEIWDPERITLDFCQNHLPSDSGGSRIWIRFYARWDWHDFRELPNYSDKDITKIKICDDGAGYSPFNLGLLASTKRRDEAGKFGEGVKMAALAALRKRMEIELRSRNWIATPAFKEEIIEKGRTKKPVQRLVFRVRERLRDGQYWDDRDNPKYEDYGYLKQYEKSSTTIINPTRDVINEFRHISEKILAFSTITPIIKEKKVEVLAMTGGKLFVRQIIIPGDHPIKFTYHFPEFNIETRDRNVISKDGLQDQIRTLLTRTTNKEFISEFLRGSAAYSQESSSRKQCLEFETPFYLTSGSKQADAWINTFFDMYGDGAGIRDERDKDFDAVHRARHMGIKLITLPSCVNAALKDLKNSEGKQIPTYESLLNEAITNAIPVPYEELTEQEKRIVQQLKLYNIFLGEGMPIREIKIYDYPKDYIGKRANGFASYFSDYVNISREALHDGILKSGHVFFHEADHAITATDDPDPGFRDYLSTLLAINANKLLPFQNSVDDGGVISGINMEDFRRALNELSKMIGRDKEEEIKDV